MLPERPAPSPRRRTLRVLLAIASLPVLLLVLYVRSRMHRDRVDVRGVHRVVRELGGGEYRYEIEEKRIYRLEFFRIGPTEPGHDTVILSFEPAEWEKFHLAMAARVKRAASIPEAEREIYGLSLSAFPNSDRHGEGGWKTWDQYPPYNEAFILTPTPPDDSVIARPENRFSKVHWSTRERDGRVELGLAYSFWVAQWYRDHDQPHFRQGS